MGPRKLRIANTVHGAKDLSRLAMFKSYMDEAGIQFNDAYCTIGGYVGDVVEWEKVERDWNFALSEFKVPYFHALEFYGSDSRYKNWKDSKRAVFINLLFDCLRDHELC